MLVFKAIAVLNEVIEESEKKNKGWAWRIETWDP